MLLTSVNFFNCLDAIIAVVVVDSGNLLRNTVPPIQSFLFRNVVDLSEPSADCFIIQTLLGAIFATPELNITKHLVLDKSTNVHLLCKFRTGGGR